MIAKLKLAVCNTGDAQSFDKPIDEAQHHCRRRTPVAPFQCCSSACAAAVPRPPFPPAPDPREVRATPQVSQTPDRWHWAAASPAARIRPRCHTRPGRSAPRSGHGGNAEIWLSRGLSMVARSSSVSASISRPCHSMLKPWAK